IYLFLPHINSDRHPVKIEFLPNLVLQIPFIWISYILGQIAKEGKLWVWGGQLGTKFDFHILPLICGRGIVLYKGQHYVIELTGRNLSRSIFVHGYSGFYCLINTLFGKYRNKNNRHIGKGFYGLF